MSKWINVKDRLPKNSTGVIATDGDSVAELYFYNKFAMPYCDYDGDESARTFIETITHWMPLPEPPK